MKYPLKLLREALNKVRHSAHVFRSREEWDSAAECQEDIADIEKAVKLLENPMTEERARGILGEWIKDDDTLYAGSVGLGYYARINWLRSGPPFLHGSFTPDQLDAIAWWVRNKSQS